ncbi:hypothetical protein [Peribacillus sp. RS7]
MHFREKVVQLHKNPIPLILATFESGLFARTDDTEAIPYWELPKYDIDCH